VVGYSRRWWRWPWLRSYLEEVETIMLEVARFVTAALQADRCPEDDTP